MAISECARVGRRPLFPGAFGGGQAFGRSDESRVIRSGRAEDAGGCVVDEIGQRFAISEGQFWFDVLFVAKSIQFVANA